MAGFKLPKKTARLVFDGDYKGLEVVVRLNVPLGVFLKIQDLLAAGKVGETLTLFAEAALESWNVEDDDGQPIPARSEGLLRVDLDMATRLVQEWQAAVVNPPAPLVGTSAGGGM